MIGPSNVGKSALIIQYVMHSYFEQYNPTIEDAYRVYTHIHHTKHLIHIFDIDENLMLHQDILKQGDGFVCIYSVTSCDSFRHLHEMIQQLFSINGNNTKLIIVGNKIDLCDEVMVGKTYGRALAQKYGAEYIETSVKTNYNVKEVFDQILQKCLE